MRWLSRNEKAKGPRVYDPREGGDFRFGPYSNGAYVSAGAAGYVVVHMPPSSGLLSSPEKAVVGPTSRHFDLDEGIGFVCAFAVPTTVEGAMPKGTLRQGQGLLSYFAASQKAFVEHFALLNQMRFGELTLGCASDELVPTPSAPIDDFDLLFVASQLQSVKWCVSFYADTGDLLVVAKASASMDQFLVEVRGRLTS